MEIALRKIRAVAIYYRIIRKVAKSQNTIIEMQQEF